MNLVLLNRHRERRETAVVGSAVTWPRTAEQAERVRACRDRAAANGNRDLVDFYDAQLARSARRQGIDVDGPGSTA